MLDVLLQHMQVLLGDALMDDVHLLTARHFRYDVRATENLQQQFGAREVCCASQGNAQPSLT